MDKNIAGLKPEAVWKYFAEICKIPHPSFHEEAMRKYLVAQAERMGLKCVVDGGGNVIIRKPATPGMEGRKGIILQAHADMVPQKNSDKKFDFEKDAIEAYVDGDWVTADGTTLGADNGMGMAAILAVLESTDLKHGPLEALITATEETGMYGAFALKAGELHGEIMLNLDSETEGELIIGCAGGLDADILFDYIEEPITVAGAVSATGAAGRALHAGKASLKTFKIELKGLLGGHSGIEIILERGNANKILCRLLKTAAERYGLRIASIDGGGLRNAIPREAVAVVMVPEERAKEFVRFVGEFEAMVRAELKGVDDGLTIRAAEVAASSGAGLGEGVSDPGSESALPEGDARQSRQGSETTSGKAGALLSADKGCKVMDAETQRRLLEAVQACPDGVMRMSQSMKGIVQTSTNLARIEAGGGKVSIQCLLRSASNSEKEYLGDRIESVFSLAGARTELTGAYNGWDPDPDSPILKAMRETYKELFGHEPEVTAVHAGLECGIIGSNYPTLDMISFGPTIVFPHSPDEKVNVQSVGKFWEYLKKSLENAPVSEGRGREHGRGEHAK